jgi:hypothetical protein
MAEIGRQTLRAGPNTPPEPRSSARVECNKPPEPVMYY